VHLVGFIIRNLISIYGIVSERKPTGAMNSYNLFCTSFQDASWRHFNTRKY